MESWVTVGGGKKSTNAAGQGHRPSPLEERLLGGMNRGQGERSGADAPNNGATRQRDIHTISPTRSLVVSGFSLFIAEDYRNTAGHAVAAPF